MKIAIVAAGLCTLLGSIHGLPTESTTDLSTNNQGNDNGISSELATSAEITGRVTLQFTCPGDAPASRTFEFGVSVTNGNIAFAGGRNVENVSKRSNRDVGNSVDGRVEWDGSLCVPASNGRASACRYTYRGWASANWNKSSNRLWMQQFPGTPAGYSSFQVGKVCQTARGRPQGWCPPSWTQTQACQVSGYSVSPGS